MLACPPSRGVVPVPVRRRLRVITAFAGLALLQCTLFAQPTPHAQTSDRPNVVLILTDDQRWDSLSVMPEVQRLLVRRGMTFRQAVVTNPLCCPSRATILTGRYSHTTGVYFNRGPHGGWNVFRASESSTIATALDGAGYRTALIGKYLNGYGGDGIYVPPGWDRWFAFTENPGYYDYTMYDSSGRPHRVPFGSEPEEYSTDVIRRTAVEFIRGTPEDTPLFLMVTPYAPHRPSIPAPRHLDGSADAPVDLGPAVGEADVSDKPAHIRRGDRADPTMIRGLTRDRWETLLAVDELVSRILTALRDTGRRNNTLVIFTSDNGYAVGEHRWEGKLVPYEESIQVPMIVGFPGAIPGGTVSDALVSNVDIAPTIADFAGVSLPVDGVSLRPLLTDDASSARGSVVLEHLMATTSVPTYCGVRTPSFTFVHYATGEEELYDLIQDPQQQRNAVSSRPRKADELRNLTMSLCRPVPPGFSWG